MTQRISRMAIAFTIAIGAIVLLGWFFDIAWVTKGVPGGTGTMKANTALCFILSGVSLAIGQRKRQRPLWQGVARLFAGVTIAIATLTLLQYIFNWNLGIDRLLFSDLVISPTNPYPGRMQETTAFNFILVGTALFLLLQKQPRCDRIVQILSAIVAFIAFVPIAGYLFGASLLYTFIVPGTSIAFHTAITFIILSMGILFARPHQGFMQTIISPLAGGLMAQKLLPGAILLPLILTWLIVEGHKLDWYDEPTAYAYISTLQILIFSIGIYVNARSLNRIENDRQQAQRHFQRAIINSPVPIMLHANNGDVLQINATWSRITGYQFTDIPTIYHWIERAYRENKHNVRELLKNFYRSEEGRVFEKELTIRTKTGEARVWYFYGIILSKAADGRKIAMTTAIDLTERKQAEQALLELNKTLENRVAERTAQLERVNAKLREELQQRQKAEQALQESQALLTGIIESATDSIAAVDLDYCYLAFNQANRQEMHSIFGMDIEVGMSLREALAHLPQERDTILKLWDRALSGEQFTLTEKFGDATLNRNDYELNYSPIRDSDRQIVGASLICKNVSDRIKAERSLRESEARFHAFMNNSTAFAWIVNLQGKFIYCNNKYSSNFLGEPPEKIIGKTLEDLFPPAMTQQYRENNQWVAETSKTLETQETGRILNGSKCEFLVYKFPIDRPGERLIGGVAFDLTDRITAERSLRESEARFQAFMNYSPALAWISDRDGKIVYCNQNLANLFRQSVEELTGKTPFDLHSRELAEEHIANNRMVFERGQVIEVIESAIRADGSPVDYLVYKFPLETGSQECLVGAVGLDITDRKRAETALLESEAKLQAIIENAPAAVYLKDRQGQHLLVNRYCLEILNVPIEQYIGKTARELLPVELVEQLAANERQVWESGSPCSFEEDILLPDGIHTFYSVKFLLRDLTGNPYALCGISTDITDRKQAEAALLQAKEVAEAANRAKSAFLTNMSHELRTPLNAIIGFTQVLARDPSLNPKQQEQIAIVNSSGEHLLTLINDVLEISKIEAGRLALNPSSFDFYALLESLESMLQLKAQSKGLQLIFDRDCVPRYITTDESKLRQILTNLVGNAIKFTSIGGVCVRVRAQACDPPRSEELERWYFYFEIEDTGAGIAEEDLDKLFMPFTQTNTGKRSSEGTGLGLTISQKFVQMMGGDIQLSSHLNAGTVVKFTIQVTIACNSNIEVKQQVRRAIALEPGQPTYRILVVDDRAETRRLMRDILEPLGFAVREAENGKQALEMWETWEPHLIWMDMRMPVMDGYEATRQIKAHLKGQATVVIALTASAFEENRSTILSGGCDDFLPKPCREAAILEKLAQHLGVRYLYEEVSTPEDRDAALDAATVLDPSVLQVMPSEWIAAFHHAALSADSTALLPLLEQIPEESAAIAELLGNWIDNFRFDKITALTEALFYE